MIKTRNVLNYVALLFALAASTLAILDLLGVTDLKWAPTVLGAIALVCVFSILIMRRNPA